MRGNVRAKLVNKNAFTDTNLPTDLNPTCDIIPLVAMPLQLAVCPTFGFVLMAELCWKVSSHCRDAPVQ